MTFIKSPKDFWAGILYIAFGLATVLIALNYSAGTAGRMGPGYFPRALGSLMMLLGAFLCIRATRITGPKVWLGSGSSASPFPFSAWRCRRCCS